MKTRIGISITALASAALLYTLVVAVPQASVDVERIPVSRSPADMGISYQNFTVTPADAHLSLQGWWMPAAQPVASLVFIHGGGSNRTSEFFGSLDFYQALVARGVSVAAIDLRNHGHSGQDGLGLQFGRTEKYDAMATIEWVRAREPGLPLYAMGISMGGATVIHAASSGAPVDGLILLDPLLDTNDVFRRGGWVETGLPDSLFALSSWSARNFFGLPDGEAQALHRATSIDLPILLIQDPADPVTRLPFARQLAAANPGVSLWVAPDVAADDERLAWKGRWGTHVAAFQLYPAETIEQLMRFIHK
jgi:alpha-beta hydrolase superfamily lysophospholipase